MNYLRLFDFIILVTLLCLWLVVILSAYNGPLLSTLAALWYLAFTRYVISEVLKRNP